MHHLFFKIQTMKPLLVTQCHRPCNTYFLECKKDEPVIVDSDVAMIMVTEGRFDRVKGRKFEPLCSTEANSGDILLLGCEFVNKAIVCIPKPAFLASETSSDSEQKAENALPPGNIVIRPIADNGVMRPLSGNGVVRSEDKAQQPLDKENKTRKSPANEAAIPSSGMFVSRPLVAEEPQKHPRVEESPGFPQIKTLLKTYGDKVLSVCRQLLEGKTVVIRYGDFSLKAVIQQVKLDTNAFIGRDKSYIKLVMAYTINNQPFVADHAVFAAEFRKMINDKVNTVGLSVWQRTFIWYDNDSLGYNLDKLIPYNVRRFYDENDIKDFLLNR